MAESFYFRLSDEEILAYVSAMRLKLTPEREAQVSGMSEQEVASIITQLESDFSDLTGAPWDAVSGNNYYGPREPSRVQAVRRDAEKAENERLRDEGRTLPGE